MNDYPPRGRSLPVRAAPPVHRCSRIKAPQIPPDRRIWSAWVRGLIVDLARHLTDHRRHCARRI